MVTRRAYCSVAQPVPQIAPPLLVPNSVAGAAFGNTPNSAGTRMRPPPPTTASMNPASREAPAATNSSNIGARFGFGKGENGETKKNGRLACGRRPRIVMSQRINSFVLLCLCMSPQPRRRLLFAQPRFEWGHCRGLLQCTHLGFHPKTMHQDGMFACAHILNLSRNSLVLSEEFAHPNHERRLDSRKSMVCSGGPCCVKHNSSFGRRNSTAWLGRKPGLPGGKQKRLPAREAFGMSSGESLPRSAGSDFS